MLGPQMMKLFEKRVGGKRRGKGRKGLIRIESSQVSEHRSLNKT